MDLLEGSSEMQLLLLGGIALVFLTQSTKLAVLGILALFIPLSSKEHH